MLKISKVQAEIGASLTQLMSVQKGSINRCIAGLLSLFWLSVGLASPSITAVEVQSLGSNAVQVRLIMSEPVDAPLSFTVDNPARVALDFPGVKNEINRNKKPKGAGIARQIRVVEGQGKTRVVVSLDSLVPYETIVLGPEVIVYFGEQKAIQAAQQKAKSSSQLAFESVSGTAAGQTPSASNTTTIEPMAPKGSLSQVEPRSHGPVAIPRRSPLAEVVTNNLVENLDFRRGPLGQGKIVVQLSNPGVPVEVMERGGKIVMEFARTALPSHLYQRVDVLDFGTPITEFETAVVDDKTQIIVTPTGEYEFLSFQLNEMFTLEVKEIPPDVATKLKVMEFTGQKLSLNFQSIEVRSVLQMLADINDINLVTSDTVTGSVTLALKNVPWDQALDIILKTKGLAKRSNGNVMLIAPADEIAAREKLELENLQSRRQLEPLRTEFVQVSYAKATDIAALLKGEGNSLLSERGSVTIDERTNTLLVNDTPSKLAEVRNLVKTLDVPIRQVLIESRIVIATSDFGNDLGVRFGATGVETSGNNQLYVSSAGLGGTDTMIGSATSNLNSTGSPFPISLPSLGDRLNVNLPAVPARGTPAGIALAFLDSDYLLDLELTALQAEGTGEIISNPRVVTSDQNEAIIRQGKEIPYQTVSNSGTSVQFKNAVLQLTVTPQITPDDRVFLSINVKKDEPDFSRQVNGTPPIDVREVNTEVLLKDGETVVLGGIYETTDSHSREKVPYLGDIPFLGALFRRDARSESKSELLVFITPKIMRDEVALN
jgi:type IV pilus assembly protein PilQ